MMDGSALTVDETESPQITIRNCANISGNLTVMLSPRNLTGTNNSVVVMDAGCLNGTFRDVNLVFKQGSCVDAKYSRQEKLDSVLAVFFDLTSTMAPGCSVDESSAIHLPFWTFLSTSVFSVLL